MLRAFALLLLVFVSNHFVYANTIDVTQAFAIEKDRTDTVVAVNKRVVNGQWLADRIRISRPGVARLLVQYKDEFYLIDKAGDLWRLNRSKHRLFVLNFARMLAVTGGTAIGFNLGFYLSQHNVFIAESIPWVIAVSSFATLAPRALFSNLPFFDGEDFFTEKLVSGVESVFRTRTENYELIFSDNRKNKMLSDYAPSEPSVLSCEAWLSSFW